MDIYQFSLCGFDEQHLFALALMKKKIPNFLETWQQRKKMQKKISPFTKGR